jgi:hypothetical protein
MRLVEDAKIVPLPLQEWDESGETVVHIKEARQREIMLRGKYADFLVVEFSRNGTRREIYDVTEGEMELREVFLTFAGCNLCKPGAEDESPILLFPDDISEQEFRERWAELPPTICGEWHDLVRSVNPEWEIS